MELEIGQTNDTGRGRCEPPAPPHVPFERFRHRLATRLVRVGDWLGWMLQRCGRRIAKAFDNLSQRIRPQTNYSQEPPF